VKVYIELRPQHLADMTVNPEEDPAYLLSATGLELERLRKQHEWIVSCFDGKVIFAPIDLQKPQLKILDVGCADGKCPSWSTEYS
jgi:hypothetical protein